MQDCIDDPGKMNLAMHSKPAGLFLLFASLGSIGVICTFCFHFVPASPTTVALLLLLVVLITSISTRLLFAILAAVVATLCLDVFFLPPIGRITIADPENWITLIVFLVICLVAGNLSNQLRAERDSVVIRQREAEKVHSLSRSLLMSSPEDDMRRLIVNGCTQFFQLEEFVLYEQAADVFHCSTADHAFPQDAMRSSAEPQTQHLQGREWMLLPVSLGNLCYGSIAYVQPSAIPAGSRDGVTSIIALGLAQVQAQEASNRAHAVRRSEELKSVMIDALAHDLKTPLTSIEAAADMLGGVRPLSSAQWSDMILVIQEETRGLRRLVDEATHLARIDAKRLRLELRPCSVRAVIDAAIASLGDRSDQRIQQQIPVNLDPILADAELITQAVKQLIDNGLKYGPPRSPVFVVSSELEGTITIAVRDTGPGLTELEQSKVFEKFYRGRYDRSAIQGTGMGLSIAREIVEAHGGSLGVRSYVGQGTEFLISLPAHAAPHRAAAREFTV